MGHSKDPGPGILKLVSFPQSSVQPKKHFLGSLLSPWGVQSQREQVPVYVVARLLIELPTSSRNVAVFRSCPIMPTSSAPRGRNGFRSPLRPFPPSFQLHHFEKF